MGTSRGGLLSAGRFELEQDPGRSLDVFLEKTHGKVRVVAEGGLHEGIVLGGDVAVSVTVD